MKLYSMPSSGNSYKVRLLASLLGLRLDIRDVESGSDELAEARAAGRLPFGKAPVLEVEDGTLLPESNAILCFLGEGTRFVPDDTVPRAQMLGWMFWEQYSHEPVIAVRAALRTYPERAAQATPERMADLLDRGHAALERMEAQLAGYDWLVGDGPSLADISLYAYTHTAADRGGFDMSRFPGIGRWLARIARLPGHVGLHG